jgi:cephalosporin-C deacetylase-like acetyl esterase
MDHESRQKIIAAQLFQASLEIGSVATMVTRRSFLAAQVTAAAQSALSVHWPDLNSFAAAIQSPAGTGRRSRRDFWDDWPDYMTRRMNQARSSRKLLLTQLQTKEQIADRSATVRSQLWQLIGGRPDKTPLNARTMGTIERDEYRIEKLVFESMPQVYVTAHLYVPKTGKPPYPAIIAPLGHSPDGKLSRNYQYSFQTLARKGYVVLAYDPYGQGERIQYLQPGTGHTRYHAVTMEHIQPGRPMVLFGGTFALYLAWDGIRALDYLESRPEIDPHRLGCTGQSGGGTMTMFLVALEPRIQAAVPVDANFENLAGPFYAPPGAIADAEQNIVGSLPLHLDRGDLLAAFAPKPLLMCYTVHDVGDTYSPTYQESTVEVYQELQRLYEAFGSKEKVGLFTGDLPHGLDFFSRRAMYGWFNRWFGKMDAGVDEAEFDASPEAMLYATATGQVLTSLGGRSVVQVNTDRAKQLLPVSSFGAEMSDLSQAKEQVRTQLVRLLALPHERSALQSRTLSSNVRKKQRIEEIQLESEPGVRIVGWFVAPDDGAPVHPCVLYISSGMADTAVAEPNPFDEILSRGQAICAIHLRGLGIDMPRLPDAGPVFYQQMLMEERFAWANLVLGAPVIGQRVWDILRTLDYLTARSDVDHSQIRLLGEGAAGLAALMAAALDERPRSLLLNRLLASYLSIVNSDDYFLSLDWFVPSILRHFDLPDIVAAAHPRPVWLVDAVGATGDPLSESAVRQCYSQRIPAPSPALKGLTILSGQPNERSVYIPWLAHT